MPLHLPLSTPESGHGGDTLLAGVRIVLLALNVPGPVAAARLRGFGASVIKVEPPQGDPLEALCPDWYAALHEDTRVQKLDLKGAVGRAAFETLLSAADLLITSFRPSSLQRLGLDPASVAERHARVGYVAIVGGAGPLAEIAGHDLTYQASVGLVSPPFMPPTLHADLAGAERAVSAALALLAGQCRKSGSRYLEVSLTDAVGDLLAAWHFGLTQSGGRLGGENPYYRLYETADGWIAVAALEPHFAARLLHALDLPAASCEAFEQAFASRSAADWVVWGAAHDLPVAAVQHLPR